MSIHRTTKGDFLATMEISGPVMHGYRDQKIKQTAPELSSKG